MNLTEDLFLIRQNPGLKTLSQPQQRFEKNIKPYLPSLTSKKKLMFGCADERQICPQSGLSSDRAPFAGVGAGWTEDQCADAVERIKKSPITITCIRPHKGCGGLEHFLNEYLRNGATREEAVQNLHQNMERPARMLGVKVAEPANMIPVSMHIGRMITITGVESFVYSMLCYHFGVYSLGASYRFDPTCAEAVKVLRKIVFDPKKNHRAEDLDAFNPFLVMIVGDAKNEEYSSDAILESLNRSEAFTGFEDRIAIRTVNTVSQYN